MSSCAVCSRRLQFEAGPQTHRFYVCEEHRHDLERGDVSCFFATATEPLRDEDEDKEIPCDLCREG